MAVKRLTPETLAMIRDIADDPLLLLLTACQPERPVTVRLVNYHQPVISQGQEFLPSIFTLRPKEHNGKDIGALIEVEASAFLRQFAQDAKVTIEIVQASTPDEILYTSTGRMVVDPMIAIEKKSGKILPSQLFMLFDDPIKVHA